MCDAGWDRHDEDAGESACTCGECEECLDRHFDEMEPDEPEPRENEALAWGGVDGYRDSKY